MPHIYCTNCHMDVVAVRSASSMLAKARLQRLDGQPLDCPQLLRPQVGTDS